MSHLKTGVSNGAEAASNQIDVAARKVVSTVTEEGKQSLKWIGDEIEARPVLSLLIALGLGYVGGRLLASPSQNAR
ncbi:hypothetical protein [Oryzibacter oryziterrae]|uniref:hypothetical protein n=1 Tax=Oryzibacter oryziterrae TaxID=2766474 RepID=UPI001F3C896E|nr:hypothetical protein [Oryzibacter oryziterrae]